MARASAPKPRRSKQPTLQSADGALGYAHTVLATEARAIARARDRLDGRFSDAVRLILSCTGHVVVTGIGKPGFIAQKLSSVLASTGVRSFYLHPAEAVHGDLGRVSPDDVVVALSNSGSTEELIRLLPALRRIGAKVIALTGDASSALGQGADVCIDIGRIDEACPMGLVPTASSAVLHAVSDALAMTLVHERSFTAEQYARLHPGGKLGRAAMEVGDVMRSGAANPTVPETATLSEVLAVMTRTPGRPGAASVVDRRGRLVGIFTDGDLRRLVEKGNADFERPVKAVMGQRPRSVRVHERVAQAAAMMRSAGVDQLPVVDQNGKPVGLLDVQDLLAARFL
ncbi:MAG TPA: KpsF/GutQ family sugar-phosphate isomerase [Myxococcaceae bacterium]|nr:KpsF/GutQ family sugar-phosphate isomerase [Myxococcaceae bacterium]